jgi:hypothetical protein
MFTDNFFFTAELAKLPLIIDPTFIPHRFGILEFRFKVRLSLSCRLIYKPEAGGSI